MPDTPRMKRWWWAGVVAYWIVLALLVWSFFR